jgi:hypothetical protein
MMFWALLASGQISMRKGTVGRPSPQSPLISQLTSPPETITSCYPGTRHTEFQRHSGRHPSDSRKKPFQFARGAISRNSTLTQSDRRPGGSIRDTLDRCLRSIPTPQAPPGDKPVKGSSRATRSALLPGMGIGPVLRPAVMVASVDRAGFQQKLDRPSVHRPETRATLSRQHLAPRCMMNPSDPTVGSGCNGEYRFSRGDQPSISTSKLHIDRDGAER